MNTEGGRMAVLLSNTRRCMTATALAKARALTGSAPCGGSCTLIDSTVNKPVPPASTDLILTTNCYMYQGAEPCVPASVNTARIQQRSIDLATDPNDPVARFSAYRRPFIQVCPPIPQWYYTAGEPVLQGNCQIGTDSAEVALNRLKNPNST